MAQLNPYLNFDNNCLEAMNFYKDCLGGELFIQTVGELPAMAAQMPPQMKDKVLHAELKSGDIRIMASDLNRHARVEGNTYSLCVNCSTEQELVTLFSKFGAGASIVSPLADMPWGGRHAELTDKFGKQWMFNFQPA